MKKVLSIALLVSLMASCSGPKPLYSWYNYEDATYQYDKKQSEVHNNICWKCIKK